MSQSLLLRILPKDIVQSRHEMGETWKRMKQWSLAIHILFSVLLILALWMILKAPRKELSLLLILSALTIRHLIFVKTRQAYKDFCNQRNTEFLYFFTMIVPYIRSAVGQNTGLYRILSQLEMRLEDRNEQGQVCTIKKGVNRLMLQMTNNPGDIGPFIEFAKMCSGSELAEDVAIALFDFQQNSNEQDAIIRLKEKVDRALQKRIEEIVDMKLERFRWYSTRVVMSVFILVIGILGTSIWAELVSTFNLIV